MPKFSIIVPVYKSEKYIDKCVQSILKQTFEDFECILVDDDSPDNCPRICDDYSVIDKRIKVFHKNNQGLVFTRKAGVDISTGDYLVFVDSDDWIDSHYLEKFWETIAKTSCDIVCCGYFNYKKGKKINHKITQKSRLYLEKDLKIHIFPFVIQNEKAQYFAPSLWGKAFKRDLYLKNQLEVTKISMGEDGACTIPCIVNAKSMYLLEDCLYSYRIHNLSITKSKKVLDMEGPMIISSHISKCINTNLMNFKQQLYRKNVHELFSVIVSQFFRKDSYRIICKDIEEILNIPFYSESIRNARFTSLKAMLMHFSLKHRLFFLIKLYSKIK